MKPVGKRRVRAPWMPWPDVIRDLVLEDLDAQRVRFLDQLAQGRESTEAILDGVIVDRMIAVVVRVWAPRFIATVYAIPVVVPRCEPECCDAEIFQVGQLVDYAAQVTAVKAAWVVAIVGFGWRVFRIVVRCITVNEAIRHDQVDHVVGSDALISTFTKRYEPFALTETSDTRRSGFKERTFAPVRFAPRTSSRTGLIVCLAHHDGGSTFVTEGA